MTRPSPRALGALSAVAAVVAISLAAPVKANLDASVRRTPVVEAVERAAPAVVNITTDALTRQGMGRGTGSGVIVHPQGYVVTNSHVVRGAQRIFVSLCKKAGQRPFSAELLKDDPSHDLALLRIRRPNGFPYVRLCPTTDVLVGETAIAIGNPYGLGDTVTVGIVSASGRRAAMPNGQTLRNLLQTDASINLGNSGGALLNLEGALIGVNCSIHPSAQGISFTVPSDDVKAMLEEQLRRSREPDPLPTAAPPRSPTASSAAKPLPAPSRAVGKAVLGLSLKTESGGVRITSIVPDSSADIGGLEAGDLIVEVDDEEVESATQVEKVLGSGYPGRTYFIGVQRGNDRKRAIVVFPGN
jgi:serine protease Do